jgi:hypothetical protein
MSESNFYGRDIIVEQAESEEVGLRILVSPTYPLTH